MKNELHSARVLIVDDLPGTRRILRSALTEAGVSAIEEASNGTDAIAQVNDKSFDLVICDFNMGANLPTGLDVFNAMQNSEMLRAIPFILLTAQIDLNLLREAEKSGVFAYVPKPVREDVVTGKANHALRAQRLKAAREVDAVTSFEAL